MTFLRIRQAEVALADGRLDEALDLVSRPDVRAHRKGQDLVTRLCARLLERARKWVEMDRPADAIADADRVIRLAGQLPEAAELKAAAAAAMLGERERHRRSAEAVARARLHLQQGRLATAAELVRRNGGCDFSTGGLQVIMDDLHDQQQRLDAALVRASAALARHDHESAIAELATARRLDASSPKLAELTDTAHRELIGQAREAIDAGRLDLAGLIEHRLARLAPQALDVEQVRQTLALLRNAWDAVDRGQPRKAEEALRRLVPTLPNATWLRSAADRLNDAAVAVEAVRAGPMGLLAAAPRSPGAGPGGHMDETIAPPAAPAGFRTAPAGPPPLPGARRPPSGAAMTSRLLVQVDGAGSFVIVREPAVSFGPISSSGRVSVGLICEPNTPTVSIERVEDDYFLRCPPGGTVSVNDTPAASRLLAAGDRIALSPRCRMLFHLPVPASTTAAVDLTGARYPRGDVRRVLLMDRDVVIGPGGASHVRLDALNEPIVLIQRDGHLYLRGGTAVTMADQPLDEHTPLRPNAPIRGAGFGLVITPL